MAAVAQNRCRWISRPQSTAYSPMRTGVLEVNGARWRFAEVLDDRCIPTGWTMTAADGRQRFVRADETNLLARAIKAALAHIGL